MATVLGAMAVVVSAVAAGSGEPVKALTLLGIFGGISLTGFATNFFRAPAWVRRRDAQFADIAEHTVKLLSDHGE